jgi:hypothetical protein
MTPNPWSAIVRHTYRSLGIAHRQAIVGSPRLARRYRALYPVGNAGTVAVSDIERLPCSTSSDQDGVQADVVVSWTGDRGPRRGPDSSRTPQVS